MDFFFFLSPTNSAFGEARGEKRSCCESCVPLGKLYEKRDVNTDVHNVYPTTRANARRLSAFGFTLACWEAFRKKKQQKKTQQKNKKGGLVSANSGRNEKDNSKLCLF